MDRGVFAPNARIEHIRNPALDSRSRRGTARLRPILQLATHARQDQQTKDWMKQRPQLHRTPTGPRFRELTAERRHGHAVAPAGTFRRDKRLVSVGALAMSRSGRTRGSRRIHEKPFLGLAAAPRCADDMPITNVVPRHNRSILATTRELVVGRQRSDRPRAKSNSALRPTPALAALAATQRCTPAAFAGSDDLTRPSNNQLSSIDESCNEKSFKSLRSENRDPGLIVRLFLVPAIIQIHGARV